MNNNKKVYQTNPKIPTGAIANEVSPKKQTQTNPFAPPVNALPVRVKPKTNPRPAKCAKRGAGMPVGWLLLRGARASRSVGCCYAAPSRSSFCTHPFSVPFSARQTASPGRSLPRFDFLTFRRFRPLFSERSGDPAQTDPIPFVASPHCRTCDGGGGRGTMAFAVLVTGKYLSRAYCGAGVARPELATPRRRYEARYDVTWCRCSVSSVDRSDNHRREDSILT